MAQIPKYSLEFILHTQDVSEKSLKNSMTEFGEKLEIVECNDNIARGKNFKVQLFAEDPTIIFDICAQFGRIKSVKINET